MMTRISLFICTSGLLALVALAGEPTIDQLVERLGADDYQAREAATKALIAHGTAAIPALEKAVQAEDVEVRMRAGRALRSIREKQAQVAPKVEKKRPDAAPTPVPPRAKEGVRSTSTKMRFVNGEWEITITRGVGADRTVKTFRGKSLDELKRKHPEVREALGRTTLQFGKPRGTADPFKDFDKWFEEAGFGGRRPRDPFGGTEALQAEIERLRQWARWMAAQRARQQKIDPRQRALRDAEAMLLGIRVRKPESVLDAQLQLRGRGLIVEKVEPGTIAVRLGLQRFDILGLAVRTAADIRPALLNRRDNGPVSAKIMRRAKIVSLIEKAEVAGPQNDPEKK